MGQAFKVMQGATLLAEFLPRHVDFPWLMGPFLGTPAFEAMRPLFDRLAQARALVGGAERWQEFFQCLDDIRAAGIYLVAPDGKRTERFILHIEGDSAQLRC